MDHAAVCAVVDAMSIWNKFPSMCGSVCQANRFREFEPEIVVVLGAGEVGAASLPQRMPRAVTFNPFVPVIK
jgi:hypothetical protein